MSTTLNASTSTGLVSTADTSGTLELQSNGTTQLTVASTGAYGTLKSGTAQASTSGTSIDFTSIPSWVKRITVIFSGVSTNGSSNICMQVGTSGGIVSSGYLGSGGYIQPSNTASSTTATAQFLVSANVAAVTVFHGVATLNLLNSSTNLWAFQSNGARSDNAANIFGAGSITLSGALTQVRITTANGTDTFDAGSINIIYEG